MKCSGYRVIPRTRYEVDSWSFSPISHPRNPLHPRDPRVQRSERSSNELCSFDGRDPRLVRDPGVSGLVQEEPLHEMHTDVAHRHELLSALYAFGNDHRAMVV